MLLTFFFFWQLLLKFLVRCTQINSRCWLLFPFRGCEVFYPGVIFLFFFPGFSGRPKKSYLSRYLVSLLHYGGVPEEFFIGILRNAIDDAQASLTNKRAALQGNLISLFHDELYITSCNWCLLFFSFYIIRKNLNTRKWN